MDISVFMVVAKQASQDFWLVQVARVPGFEMVPAEHRFDLAIEDAAFRLVANHCGADSDADIEFHVTSITLDEVIASRMTMNYSTR